MFTMQILIVRKKVRMATRRLIKNKIIIFTLLFFFAMQIHPNAVWTKYSAGGIIFKKNNSISIEKEELYLSFKKVKVSYVFHSDTKLSENLEITFPMPEIPHDGSPASIGILIEDKKSAQNYMDFNVRVNGKRVKFKLIERALLGDKDVTIKLKKYHLPLVISKSTLEKISDEIKDELEMEKMLQREGNDYYPKWNYQVLFQWKQVFPHGNTSVDIEYIPSTGTEEYNSEYANNYFHKGKGAKDYCIGKQIIAGLKKSSSWDAYTLGYILKTARFWKGPIKNFRLVVEKNPNSIVAFCPANAKKISDTEFEWNAKDFYPDKDIRVLFFLKD